MLPDPLRSLLHPLLPPGLLRARKRYKWNFIRQHYASLPVATAFSEIYRTQLWGQVEGEEFFSGDGSTEQFAGPYTEWVCRFIGERSIAAVLDLGCGDFRVGNRLCSATGVRYTGVDVVPDLIAYNRLRFSRDGIEFCCANIIEDELPDADLCLIRQVLQHLSNAEISQVLRKLTKYRYVLVTEDVYDGRRPVRPNLDHLHGPDNRLHKRSGVFLDLPPYNLKAETVITLPCPETESLLRTLLIERSGSEAACSRARFCTAPSHRTTT